MQELLTVIVPIYNVERYLVQCVDSIINQTYKELEIVLVDDGSTDASGRICDEYATKDQRIKVIHKANGGLVSARKAGLTVANGNFIAFVDSDDWIDEDMYEQLLCEMVQSDSDILASGFYKEYGEKASVVYDGMTAGIYTRDSQILSRNLFFGDSISEISISSSLVTKLYKASVIKQYYMCINDNISYGEDAACVYSSIPYANSVQIVHKAYYHYRFREDSIVHKKNDSVLRQIGLLYEYLIACYRQHECYHQLRKQLSAFVTLNVFRSLNYFMDIDEDVKIPLYVVPAKVSNYGKKIVLYGAGMVGQAYEKQISAAEDMELVLWVDKMAHHYREQGKKVNDISDIASCEYDVILLAVTDYDMASEIKKDLIARGVEEAKIYWEFPKSFIDLYVNI